MNRPAIFPFGSRGARPSIAALACASAILLAACSKGGPGQMGQKPGMAPVRAATAVKKDVPLRIDVVGNIEAYATVAITSQVNGPIETIHFKEGAQVAEGDLLVTIDPRPYQAALAQAEAALARDTAQMENAQKEAARNEGLVAKGYISQSHYDQLKTAADAMRSVAAADKAAVENAKLQLGYCYINSPIGGRTGAVLVNEGNLVKANDKTLVTIFQVRPVFTSFSAPQQYLPLIRQYQTREGLKAAVLPGPGLPPVNGRLTFIDNGVDPSTGTIKLKATFANGNQALWPGQFVNISLYLTTEEGVVVIPSQAIVASQKGQFVYVVTRDGAAEMRPVSVSRSYGGESVIASGIEEGETIVTDGQLQVVPGGKVSIIGTKQDGKE